jgi:ParB-like nuclease domain
MKLEKHQAIFGSNIRKMSGVKADKLLEIKPLPVDQLLLDPENPRLESVAKTTDQLELIRAMWREMAVSEVALSIAENGFFEEEPLFAVPAPREKGEDRYYVVEGNRRLTAVKLLLDEELRKAVKATDLPSLDNQAKSKLRNLPVSIYTKREDLWAYFGFRHVNGPKEWDSLSKAAYIAKVRRDYGKSLEEITRAIGDQHSTVKRIYRGYVLLEQAEGMTKFKREDRSRNRFYFSHLYTAADYAEVQEFLGIDSEGSLSANPVGKKYLSQLEELMVWLFGSKDRGVEPVVKTQAPDLSNLRSVIGNKAALAALRSGISLDRAFTISKGDASRFEEALAQAKNALQEAKGTVTTGYKGNKELLDQMDSIGILATSLLNEMREIASRKK